MTSTLDLYSVLNLLLSIQPPVTLFGIDGRYATALYTAAARQNALEAVERDLSQLQTLINKDKAVQGFLENPTVTGKAKVEGISALLNKAGKVNPLTKNLFEALNENSRLDQTVKVLNAYAELMSAHRNELALTVTSAKVRKQQKKDVIVYMDIHVMMLC